LHFGIADFFGNSASLNYQIHPQIGLDLELLIPMASNKLAVILQPNYYYYKSQVNYPWINAELHYNSINLPLGLRYYFYLLNDQKIHFSMYCLTGLNFNINSTIKLGRNYPNDLEFNPGYCFDIGYNYKKYNVSWSYYSFSGKKETDFLYCRGTSIVFGYMFSK
jgi:hypothetical protein